MINSTESNRLDKSSLEPQQDIASENVWQMSAEDEQVLHGNGVILPMRYQQIKRYLPHRYPFFLVDRVISCRPKKNIIGYKNVSHNEPFFQGHFPDEPIMPGVLITEALAQISGILAFISEGVTAEDGYLFLFAGLDKVRFKTPVVPGDQLLLKSELLVQKRTLYKFECQAYVENKLAATAQLMIVRQDRS